MKMATMKNALPFRWRYVLLPMTILVLSFLLCIYFFHLLPDAVAYHFRPDGSPDRWLSRIVIILWAVVPQIVFTLLAWGLARGMIGLTARLPQSGNTGARLEEILMLIGNMVALPQAVLCFAMVDIFSYNSYGTTIIPVWQIAVVIMVAGIITLGILFARVIRRMLRTER
jgi:uncharacterized membrane protein